MKEKWKKKELLKKVKALRNIIRNFRYDAQVKDTQEHVLKKFRSCKNILESVKQQQKRI